ncbi:MAG TPA: hypothetical protein VFA61_00270 [Candidatus Udaeobacter sp.]|nr:hypothetical protein [Candidatus Udaeobacter sp.]
MNASLRILMLAPILLGGCRATEDVAATSYHVTRGAAVGSYKVARAVAVGSYRVASAPVHYATRKRGDESSTMVGTETPSDVTNPGQTIPPEMASASQQQQQIEAESGQSRRSSGASVTSRKETAHSSSSLSSSGRSTSSTAFPTGKLVPGKPGYVFSPFDKEGRYVDVSGFPSGTKVKDPWTNKIFLVP